MTESHSSEITVRTATTQVNRTGWLRWLPGLEILRQYQSSWLRQDLGAGIVMTTMLVPVGIAYAEASGVPGINGLYATIIPLLAYAIFGPSRILILGPDSALAPVILAVVLPLSAGDPQRAVAISGMMAIVSGVVQRDLCAKHGESSGRSSKGTSTLPHSRLEPARSRSSSY